MRYHDQQALKRIQSRLVNIGNRFRGQLEVMGEEDIAMARYRVSITDSTSLDRALLRCLLTGQCDCLFPS
ncbi:MAG: hypothetical protein ACNYPE_16960 [Candidatus Azotimanducaceae bacterium WSBS_2022_MAG_OTU7]